MYPYRKFYVHYALGSFYYLDAGSLAYIWGGAHSASVFREEARRFSHCRCRMKQNSRTSRSECESLLKEKCKHKILHGIYRVRLGFRNTSYGQMVQAIMGAL
jgi:hypothetical protein